MYAAVCDDATCEKMISHCWKNVTNSSQVDCIHIQECYIAPNNSQLNNKQFNFI